MCQGYLQEILCWVGVWRCFHPCSKTSARHRLSGGAALRAQALGVFIPSELSCTCLCI